MTNVCTYIGAGCGCSKPALEGKSYCEEHYHLVYQKGTAHRKRHKDIRRAANIRMWESLLNEAVEELESEGFFYEEAPIEL